MKVCEVIDTEWENNPAPTDAEQRQAMKHKRYRAISHQDMTLAWKLDAITKAHPNDVIVRAFPAYNDHKFTHPDADEPDQYTKNPNDWDVFIIVDSFLFDGEMQTGDEFPDAHERCYVRKGFSQVTLVKNIINRHNALEKMRGEMWRYPK